MKKYILEKSPLKDKKYRITMTDPTPHHHDFGAKDSKTFVNHKDKTKKKNWEARHSVNPNYNSKHSAIYHSKKLLWSEPTLEKAIKKYEKEHNVKIINKI